MALREPLDGGAGVPEQHTTGTVTVQQCINHGLCRLLGRHQTFQLITQPALEGFPIRVGDSGYALLSDMGNHPIDHFVLLFLFPESLQIVKACRVQ